MHYTSNKAEKQLQYCEKTPIFEEDAYKNVEVDDDLKLQELDKVANIFILTLKGENLSKESKILGQPNVHVLKSAASYFWVCNLTLDPVLA